MLYLGFMRTNNPPWKMGRAERGHTKWHFATCYCLSLYTYVKIRKNLFAIVIKHLLWCDSKYNIQIVAVRYNHGY